MNDKLTRSVIRALGGRDYLEDVANHGASGGFPGFTYYSDTVRFFKNHRAEIVELVKELADDLGENPVTMVAMFNCLGGGTVRGLDDLRKKTAEAMEEYGESVCKCLYGGRLSDDDTQVANALAWFALEEVARAETDN